jgi:hypothetical protein
VLYCLGQVAKIAPLAAATLTLACQQQLPLAVSIPAAHLHLVVIHT